MGFWDVALRCADADEDEKFRTGTLRPVLQRTDAHKN